MLITFSTKVSSDITMFGDVAVEMLKHMGQTGAIPGALLGADIAPALARLKQAVATVGAQPSGNPIPDPKDRAQDEQHDAPFVTMRQRAVPLVQLLEAAARDNADVIWYEASRSVLAP